MRNREDGAASDAGSKRHRFSAHLSIYHSPDTQRIAVAQFVGQRGLRKSLVTNRPAKTENCLAAYRSRASIGCRGIGAAVNHRGGNFDAGWETVKHQPADLVFQNRNQIAELVKISFRAMNGRGQM